MALLYTCRTCHIQYDSVDAAMLHIRNSPLHAESNAAIVRSGGNFHTVAVRTLRISRELTPNEYNSVFAQMEADELVAATLAAPSTVKRRIMRGFKEVAHPSKKLRNAARDDEGDEGEDEHQDSDEDDEEEEEQDDDEHQSPLRHKRHPEVRIDNSTRTQSVINQNPTVIINLPPIQMRVALFNRPAGAKEYFQFKFLRSEHTTIEKLLLAVDIAYRASAPGKAFDMSEVVRQKLMVKLMKRGATTIGGQMKADGDLVGLIGAEGANWVGQMEIG